MTRWRCAQYGMGMVPNRRNSSRRSDNKQLSMQNGMECEMQRKVVPEIESA